MDRRSFLRSGGAAAGVGLLAGCARLGGDSGNGDSGGGSNSGGGEGNDTGGNDTGGDGGGGSDEAIAIGALEPLSGNFTPWGEAHRAGLEFAIQEVNADGGVLDRELELVVEDTESDATEADSIFRRLAEQEGVVAATGPVSSDVGIRTARTAEDLEIANMLHMAGSDEVLTRDSRYTFRVGLVPAPTMMRAQAQLVEDAGYERVGAIIGDYAWGQAVKSSIQEFFPVDVAIETAPLGADDFKPFIRNMPDGLEMMVASGHPPGSLTIMGQQFELGYEPEVTTGPGIPPGTVFGALGETATRGFTHVHQTDVYSQEFVDIASRFAEERGERMDTHEGYGYVTGKLLAQAISDADSTDPVEIADAIRNIEFDTIFANPIQYTEWGELDNQRQLYSTIDTGAPEYYPDGEWKLVEEFRTDPLEPYDPGN